MRGLGLAGCGVLHLLGVSVIGGNDKVTGARKSGVDYFLHACVGNFTGLDGGGQRTRVSKFTTISDSQSGAAMRRNTASHTPAALISGFRS